MNSIPRGRLMNAAAAPWCRTFVAEDHLARFVLSLVRDDIDLAAITASYDSERG